MYRFWIYINGAATAYELILPPPGTLGSSAGHITFIKSLSINDTVEVWVQGPTGIINIDYIYFTVEGLNT